MKSIELRYDVLKKSIRDDKYDLLWKIKIFTNSIHFNYSFTLTY